MQFEPKELIVLLMDFISTHESEWLFNLSDKAI